MKCDKLFCTMDSNELNKLLWWCRWSHNFHCRKSTNDSKDFNRIAMWMNNQKFMNISWASVFLLLLNSHFYGDNGQELKRLLVHNDNNVLESINIALQIWLRSNEINFEWWNLPAELQSALNYAHNQWGCSNPFRIRISLAKNANG